METIQIRLPKEQLRKIDTAIKGGRYKSRSEAIRDYVERLELLNVFNEFQGLVEGANLDKEKLSKAVSIVREKLYKKYL